MGKIVKQKKKNEFINKELLGMSFVLFSAFGFFCLVTGDSVFYPVGGILQKFLLGILGFFSYPVFLSFFAGGLLMIMGKRAADPDNRVTAVALSVLVIDLFFLLQYVVNPPSGSFSDYVSFCYSSAAGGVRASTVGGALFGMIVYPLFKGLSGAGSVILYSFIALLSVAVALRKVIFRRFSDKKGDETGKKPGYGEGSDDEDSYTLPSDTGSVAETSEKRFPSFRPDERREQRGGEDRKGKRRLIVGEERFEFRSDEPAEVDNRNPSVGSEDGRVSIYSREYDRDFEEKLKYVKTPQKIQPETYGKTINTSMFHAAESSDPYRAEPIDESTPNEGIYIPQNYRKAMQGIQLPGRNGGGRDSFGTGSDSADPRLSSGDGESPFRFSPVYEEAEEPVPDILSDVVDSASDDVFVDTSSVSGLSSSFHGRESAFPEEEESYDEKEEGNFGDESNADYGPDDDLSAGETRIRADFSPSDGMNRDSSPKKKSPAKGEPTEETEGEEENPFDRMPLNFRYKAPPLDLFKVYANNDDYDKIQRFKEEKASAILKTLKVLGGVNAEIVNVVHGPTITRFDLSIPENVSVKAVTKLTEDLNLRLATKNSIRITTIPGTPYIGIEIPNEVKSTVGLRDVLVSEPFVRAKKGSLTFAIGKDIVGNPVVADITKMPHLLIAGSTGTGKSVCLNTLLISLIAKYSPAELRFIIVDPKQVEFTVFSGIPHMLFDEIICDAPKAIAMLNWAVKEMESRYSLLRAALVHNIEEYNDQIDPTKERKMPKIVIIIDEFADLMSVDKKNIEDKIARIAQKARAAGIFLILATQRPSVNIMEGSIKTNFTSRMAFKMSNAVDSQTILGEGGAEKLLGAGDMLYRTSSMPSVERAQGAYIDMSEIKNVVKYVKENNVSYFNDSALRSINEECKPQIEEVSGKDGGEIGEGNVPDEYINSLRLAVQMGSITISLLQRKFSFGFPKAGKIVDWMESNGYIVPSQTGKQKQVVMTKEQFEEKFGPL